MKKSGAKPGTRVIASIHEDEFNGNQEVGSYQHDEDDYYTLVGVIRSQPASPGKVWVKWIEGELTEEKDEEVSLSILSLESERSEMDKEFKEASKEIKEKMKVAAKIVNEAGKLARKSHAKDLQHMYDAVGPLINAMDNNGWRSSSWGC